MMVLLPLEFFRDADEVIKKWYRDVFFIIEDTFKLLSAEQRDAILDKISIEAGVTRFGRSENAWSNFVLSASFIYGLSMEQILMIFAHELGHNYVYFQVKGRNIRRRFPKHEFIADLFSLSFLNQMELDQDPIDILRDIHIEKNKTFARVPTRFSFSRTYFSYPFFGEPHFVARSALIEIHDQLKAENYPINWKILTETALRIYSEKPKLFFKGFIKEVVSEYKTRLDEAKQTSTISEGVVLRQSA